MAEFKNIIKEVVEDVAKTVNHLVDIAPEVEINFKDFSDSQKILAEGSQGSAVKFLQLELHKLGYLSDECISGNFRVNTRIALEKAISSSNIQAKSLAFVKDLKSYIESNSTLSKDFIWAIVRARGEKKKEFEYQGKIYDSESIQFTRMA